MSLYTDLIAAKVPVSSWQSDLYAPVNDTVKEILARHPNQIRKVFTSQVDRKAWYEFPFAYDPFWEAAMARARRNPDPEAQP